MPSGAATCPYCNAPLPAPPGTAARPPCPRCGEPIPAALWPTAQDQIAAGPPPAVPTSSAAPDAALGQRQRQRRTALVVLGIMGVMAVVALVFALSTITTRRQRDPFPRAKATDIALRRPGELPALGYLPPRVVAVAGIHVAELLQSEAGKQLLQEPRPALLERGLRPVLGKAGLTPEQVDHAVVAFVDEPTPHLVVVVATRLPYDLKKLADAVAPRRSLLYQQKPLYEFVLHPLGEGLLWAIEERTLIFLLRLDTPKVEQLSQIPTTPRLPEAGLPANLKTLIDERRLDPESKVWAIGDVTRAPNVGTLLRALPKEWQPLGQVKHFALGVVPREPLTVAGALETGNAQGSAALQTWLKARAPAEGSTLKIEAPPSEAPPAAQWVTFQLRTSAAAARTLLGSTERR